MLQLLRCTLLHMLKTTHLQYLEYLESPNWWAVRKAAMRRANFRCQRQKPGEPRHDGPLDVHHLHYDTLGHEGPDDVIVLCRPCHRAEHIPRNKRNRILEAYGQTRLFDRWDDDEATLPLEAA